MPTTTTMVTEADVKHNRRRSKAPAGIYRPPPARKYDPNECPRQAPNGPPFRRDSFQKQQYLESLKEYQINLYNNGDKFLNCNSYANKEILEDSKDFDERPRSRRPDQQFYVPKRRSPHEGKGVTQNGDECNINRPPSPTNSICSVASEFSGRNRYNRRHNIMSLIEDDEKLSSKPPCFAISNTENDRHRGKPNLFASETLQLIERCINSDANNSVSSNKSQSNGKYFSTESSDKSKHPVHCKENLHHSETTKRSRKSKSHRKHQSISRDSSVERRSSIICQKPFYSSNIVQDHDRYSYSYDNLNIRCSSQASSRNPSLERPKADNSPSGYEWRVRDNPILQSPGKISPSSVDCKPQRRLSDNESTKVEGRKLNRKLSYGTENCLPLSGSQTPESQCKNKCNNFDMCNNKSTFDHANNVVTKELESQSHILLKETYSDLFDGNTIVIENANISRELNFDESSSGTIKECREALCDGETNFSSQNGNTDCMVAPYFNSNRSSCITNFTNFLTPPTPCNSGDDTYQIENGSFDIQDKASCIEADDLSCPSSPSSYQFYNSSQQFLTPPMSPVENEHSLQESQPFCEQISDSNCKDSLFNEIKDTKSISEDQEANAHKLGNLLLDKQPQEIIQISKNIESDCSSHADEAINNSLTDNIIEASENMPDCQSSDLLDSSNPKKFSFCWADEVADGKDDSWDTLYDDSGNCLDYCVKQQLHDTVGLVQLEKPSNEYCEYMPEEQQINDEDYGHVIEIFDFPASFQTQDLMVIFQEYNNFDLKWVDDTHALGIFATTLQAADSLSLQHPFVKTRPLTKAIPASKTKALRLSDAQLPYKPRPATSVALARRLVSGALGLKVSITKEQRDAEKNKLKYAKEQKRLIARQREEAWEGTLGNTS